MKLLISIVFSLFKCTLTAQNIKVELSDSLLNVGSVHSLPAINYSTCDHFKEGLNRDNGELIEAVAKFLDVNSNLQVEIAAHTDSRGGSEANNALSQSRALALKTALELEGILGTRPTAKGCGGSQLVIAQDAIDLVQNPEERERLHQLNRRIELRIVAIE